MKASLRAPKPDPSSKKDEHAQTKDEFGSIKSNNLIVQLMEQKASVDEEDEVEYEMLKRPERGLAGGKVTVRSPQNNPGM